jgi:hypothetical protein
VSTARTLWRWFVFSTSFAVSASCVWLLARRTVESAQIPQIPTGFDLHDSFVEFQRHLDTPGGKQRVFLIGDSTLIDAAGMRAPSKQTLPARITQALHKYGERGERIELKTLRVPGLGPAAIYLLTEQIAEARPDRVVIALNLRSFSADWMRGFSYAETAGWMARSQLMEALSLPLFYGGLTADRLLFYRALVGCGAERIWPEVRRFQGRAFKLRERLATRADEAFATTATADMQFGLGIARWVRMSTEVDKLPRMSRSTLERSLAPLLLGVSPQHPTLRILSAVLDRFARAGIPTLIYATPVNIEHVHNMGLSTDAIDRSMQTVARVVHQHGADFVDFHALLPDRAFRDPGDHFTFDGQPNGTFRLASRVAAAIVASMPDEPDQYVVQ